MKTPQTTGIGLSVDFGNCAPATVVAGLLEIVANINDLTDQTAAEGVAMLLTAAALLGKTEGFTDKGWFLAVADICYDSAQFIDAKATADSAIFSALLKAKKDRP